ncbi:hypothetical protein COU78_05900 [Candidatus Peregrinibacteria bacterium CG10_big_fil_rev_8_21_14_0_10_49_24]|nr:MAG: hypothetical protein COV83_04605 [Candidatus Peregrinibacteria bacterium CG11_big_fil_rev_8_21_14_0_20_49_14]PIR50554.1 MAG: hypothetical protein COU78_05900 [Candidatus Peregrinibacteria bacterium CG10_big_fil_rev_8_21_14_0_10_49_24]
MAISYSQLQTYGRCPRQYEYGYIKKLPRRISAPESFGSSVHNTLKKWGDREMEGRKQKAASSKQLHLFTDSEPADFCPLTSDFLLELWHSSFIVEGYETRVEADMARLRGEQVMRFFFDWWRKEERTVLCIEKGFSLTINGTQISGRFDRIEQTERGLKVIDFKTSAVKPQEKVDADLQLSVYALACAEIFELPCAELSFLFLGEEGAMEVCTERTPGHLKDASKQILNMEQNIESGNFHPTPSRDVCRSCPYKGVCDVAAV